MFGERARERPWHAASRVGAGSGPLARPYWDVVLFAVYDATESRPPPVCGDNERGRCSCAGSIPAPLARSNRCCRRRPQSRRRRRPGGEFLAAPSIARIFSSEAFKDCNYARVESQLGVLLQMRSLLTAATGRETVLMAAALMAGQYAKPRSKDKETVVAAWTPSWTLHASHWPCLR